VPVQAGACCPFTAEPAHAADLGVGGN
jgi:hypothetical protein